MRARYVGFVFQSFHLLPSLTALENVSLPLELRGDTSATGIARSYLDRVGLTARLSHYPRQLSGGEQQRVALARAFASRPRILFADEPTGNLDTVTGKTINDLLFQLNREEGTTLVLVTHEATLASRCHRRVTLEEANWWRMTRRCRVRRDDGREAVVAKLARWSVGPDFLVAGHGGGCRDCGCPAGRQGRKGVG